ncbi:MAG: hypothetical protein WCS99_07540 [Limisphaerales bacterium]
MNKWQIICPLTAMAIVGLVVAWLQPYGQRKASRYLEVQALQTGWDLVKTTNSPQLVRIGPGLEGRLASLLHTNAGVFKVLLGDEPSPIGNGKASCRLILTNAAADSFGIRLRADSGKFHVLGYWSLSQ